MGAFQSKPKDDEAARRHKIIEKELKNDSEKFKALIKVLLLGGGDSGKSTVLKQMQLIHHTAFSEREIESFRQLIFSNLTLGMQLILDSMAKSLLELSPENAPHSDLLQDALSIAEGEPFPPDYLEPLKALWADPGVQQAVLRGNEFALPDKTYRPTNADITYCRARTTGISETKFTMKGKRLLMVDVGGQKSERRKWIHCFQDVTAIVFLASLSGYNQWLTEDWEANQMKDSMAIWESICASRWFENTAFILFLNKNDIFEDQIQRSNVKIFFPEYTGPEKDAPAARQYFRQAFEKISARISQRQIYTHITTATDTNMLRSVIASVQDVLFTRALQSANIL